MISSRAVHRAKLGRVIYLFFLWGGGTGCHFPAPCPIGFREGQKNANPITNPIINPMPDFLPKNPPRFCPDNKFCIKFFRRNARNWKNWQHQQVVIGRRPFDFPSHSSRSAISLLVVVLDF